MADLFERRQPAQADEWFRRALGVDRQNAQAWYGLALASWEQGSLDAALQAAQEAMRFQAQHVPAATLCAQILMVRGEMMPALAMADQTLRILSDPAIAQMRVAHHPRLYPEREVLLRVKGRAAFEQHRFDEAFAALDLVVRRYVDARFFAACALYHLGRYAEATERLKDYLASKEGATDSRAFLYLGCSLHAQGSQNSRAALNALNACLDGARLGAPERLRALLERGQIYEERGQLEEAQRDYEAALEIEHAPLTYYVLAALYHRSGRDQEAYTLLATLTGEASSPPGAGAFAGVAQSPGGSADGGQALPANTVVLMQPNEPVEPQVRRLMEILRERLAASAAQKAAEEAAQAAAEAAAAAAAQVLAEESPPEADAALPAPRPKQAFRPPAGRSERQRSLRLRSSRRLSRSAMMMPTLSAEGAQAQAKSGDQDEGAGEE